MNNISEQFNFNIYLSIIAFIFIFATIIVFHKENYISKKIIDFISYYFITLIIFNTIMAFFFQNIFYVKICILLSVTFLVVKFISLFFHNYFFYFNFKAMNVKKHIEVLISKKEIKKVEVFFNKKEDKLICNVYLYSEYSQEMDFEIIELITKKNKLVNDVNVFYL